MKKGQINATVGIVIAIFLVAVVFAIGIFMLDKMEDNLTEDVYGYVLSTTTTNKSLNASSFVNVTFSADQAFSSLVNLTPNVTFKVQINQTETTFGGGVWYTRYKGTLNTTINASEFKVYNRTVLVGAGNYTITQVASTSVMVNLTTGGAAYATANLTLLYNRTFTSADNLADTSLCYTVGDCPLYTTTGTANSYGQPYGFKLKTPSYTVGTELNNQDYRIIYNWNTRTLGTGTNAAGNSTLEMIDEMAEIPGWVGIMIVAIFAVMIIGMFIAMRYGQ